MKTFGHSGDIGDVIYALPAIRAKGGGDLVLYNNPGRTYKPMTKERVESLRPLLEYQRYIHSVRFSEDGTGGTSIDGWRDHHRAGNTSDCALSTQGLGWEHRQEAWLRIPQVRKTTRVIMAWTERHHSFQFPWRQVVERYSDSLGFVGYQSDLEKFRRFYGVDNNCIDFIDAPDFMQIAQVVAGCELYIGNLTSITAVAEGLKHRAIVEGYAGWPANDFLRQGLVVAYSDKIEFP